MEKFFYNLGRKIGTSIKKGKWYYQSAFGSEDETMRAELAVGRELARKISQETKIINDAARQKVLDEIGARLYKNIVNKKRQFKFYLVASSSINAFALPGGLIFMTDELFSRIRQSHDEIAFVLAHEMMHIVLKHPMDRILAEYSTHVVSKILMRGGSLGVVANQVLASLLTSSYSQDKEFEADEYAVRLMYSGGYHPGGAKTLLNKLRKEAPENMPIYNYFISHPPIDERVKRIDSIIKQRAMQV